MQLRLLWCRYLQEQHSPLCVHTSRSMAQASAVYTHTGAPKAPLAIL
jgi:hypothetical protein